MHLGLHRMQAVMHVLGDPHRKFPVLHIAGTNGKGSVAAFSESILRHGGRRTGLYTSPHLVRIEERIQVAGRLISPPRFASLIERIREAEAELLEKDSIDRPLTFFEFITACAFLHFCDRRVDIAVIEVGLGGLLDATNVVVPRACVITGISWDHQNLLGHTLGAIAGEKAGIIKPGVPVVSGCRAGEARRVIRGKAREMGAPLLELGRDFTMRVTAVRNGRPVIDLQTPGRTYRRLQVALAGEHQARNAALAVAATEQLEMLPANASAVRSGLVAARWPGRLDQYDAQRRTLMEGAHNPEGILLLRQFLRERKEKEVHLVFGAVRDKDIRRMTAALFPLAQSIHLTPLRNSRSAAAEDIAAINSRFHKRIELHPDSRSALEAAWDRCSRKGLVVVTGSLYLVGELLPVVQESNRSLRIPR